ncbi:MAG TPA: hypothetical protein VJN29_19195 [Intrasporangium sp.]|uniref:hypothetical protein n=1 Tax=Intrasporangium sp. TaxID=1925024 RepID=UPI002B498218|nr:hypothetical protein [Intrasporangium sp.]HKX69347.1 hypothetical protein [Intrasporangium sp.]
MNANQVPHGSDVEREVAAALHGRLDPMKASVDLSDSVVARSRTIRRHRQMATGAAVVVAALTVAAPLTWTMLRGASDQQLPALPSVVSTGGPTTTGVTSGSTTPLPSTSGPTTGATTGAATTGPQRTGPQANATTPVAVPTFAIPDRSRRTVSASGSFQHGSSGDAVWSVGKTVHRDGRTFTLEVGDAWQYLPLAAGMGLAIDGTNDSVRTVRLVGPDGTVRRELTTIPASHSGVSSAASADGSTVALYAFNPSGPKGNDAVIYAWDSTGRELGHKSNLVHTAHLAGWYGGHVFLGNHTSGHSYTWDFATNTIDNYYDGGSFGTVNAAGFAAAFTPTGEGFTGCTEILDVTGTTAKALSTHCGDFQAFGPSALSPDGRYLAGSNAYQDGFAATVVRVLDTRSGRVVLEVTDEAFLNFGFTAEGSLALDVLKSERVSGSVQVLARCTVDGACNRFTDQVGTPDELAPPMRVHLLNAR